MIVDEGKKEESKASEGECHGIALKKKTLGGKKKREEVHAKNSKGRHIRRPAALGE